MMSSSFYFDFARRFKVLLSRSFVFLETFEGFSGKMDTFELRELWLLNSLRVREQRWRLDQIGYGVNASFLETRQKASVSTFAGYCTDHSAREQLISFVKRSVWGRILHECSILRELRMNSSAVALSSVVGWFLDRDSDLNVNTYVCWLGQDTWTLRQVKYAKNLKSETLQGNAKTVVI